MENYKTLVPFIRNFNTLYKVSIEVLEIPVCKKKTINLRSRHKQESNIWKRVSISPQERPDILDKFLLVLSNTSTHIQQVRKLELVIDDDSISNTECHRTVFTTRLFNHNIYFNNTTSQSEGKCYASISYNSFEVKNLRNSRRIVGGCYKEDIRELIR